jgi:hypothetical protein
MENIFKIAKYSKENDIFVHQGYDEYSITYLKGLKVHQIRIVVNGFLTKETINLTSYKGGYKNKILLAIKDFKENSQNCKTRVTKRISIDYIKQFYSKLVIKNIENYLLNISKEESRDKLTECGLINLNII